MGRLRHEREQQPNPGLCGETVASRLPWAGSNVRIAASLLHTKHRHRACSHTFPPEKPPSLGARLASGCPSWWDGGARRSQALPSHGSQCSSASWLPLPRMPVPCLANPCVFSGSTHPFPCSSPCPWKLRRLSGVAAHLPCLHSCIGHPQSSSPASHSEKPRGARCVDSASLCHLKAKWESSLQHRDDRIMIQV